MRLKKVEGFDPQKYLKLEKAPLGVWIGEFLKRNKEFIEECNRVEQERVKSGRDIPPHFFLMYGFDVKNWERKKQGRGGQIEAILPPPVKGVRIFDPEDRTALEKLRKLQVSARARGEQTDSGLFDVCDLSLTTIRDYEYIPEFKPKENELPERFWYDTALESLFGVQMVDYRYVAKGTHLVYDAKDKLLLAVDLRGKKEDIFKEINRYLETHSLPEKPRVLPNKWPFYLMVFDLRHQNPNGKRLPFEKIRETIVEAVKQDTGLQNENEASRYYKRCVKLINGGYRRYL